MRSPRLLVAAVLCLVAAGGAAAWALARPVTAERARPGLRVGLIVNLQGYDGPGRLRAARLAARTGVTTVRDDLDWDTVEPRPGVRDWREADAIFASAARAGLVVLPILGSTPRWAGRANGGMPRDPAPYARFVADAVRRYGRRGTFWRGRPELDAGLAPEWFELFNEPYLALGVPGGPRPAAYARTVAAAVPAGRRVDPRARFLLAADTTAIEPDGDERPWLTELYRAVPDLGRHFDGVAVHPYAGDSSPDRYTPGDARWQSRRIEEIRAELVARGAADKPVWITEVGWSTCRGGDECVGERAQAKHLARIFALASERWSPWVAAVFVYALEDFQAPTADKETAFGLSDPEARRKPAWRVLQQAAGAR